MRETTKEKAPRRPISKFLIFLNLLLCLALVAVSVLYYNLKQSSEASIQTMAQAQEQLIKETIPLDTFKEYAQQYSPSIEFLQRFFDDQIVYKDNGVVFEPIDYTLPQNNYNFDNLVKTNGEIQYMENGVSAGYKGIDVSFHQGDIDWKKVKADGVDFAIIRIARRGYGEAGLLDLDPMYKENIEGALEAGLKVGVYCYSQAITVEEALEEADLVIENLKGYDITYPVVYDAEEVGEAAARTDSLTTEERTDMAIAFCERIKEAGYEPMIYANIKYFMAQLDLSRLTEYDKWFAQYFNRPFFPYDFQIWQYTGSGKVDGIAGNVDLNISFVDYSRKGETAGE